MKKLIACCGLDCELCDAYIATIKNDDALREQIAEKWRTQYGVDEITAEMINCTGCRLEGAKIGHCTECEIRICVQKKGYGTCAECAEIETCPKVGSIHKVVPEARKNLVGA
ncbi:MAG: DUF3795 domain-containing protein [Bacteroidales bacterium]|nr:DUF3795 domain-containing protein [Bacteroidales bacterium]